MQIKGISQLRSVLEETDGPFSKLWQFLSRFFYNTILYFSQRKWAPPCIVNNGMAYQKRWPATFISIAVIV